MQADIRWHHGQTLASGQVAEFKPARRHRVFLPQALGADAFLRVTWHESDRVVVFSHWQGERCIAATPVLVTDTTDLTALLVDALGDAAIDRQHSPRTMGRSFAV